MRELAARFVPAADEVYRLQVEEDAEGRLFRRIAAQGHFGGRRLARSTRQGIYAFTPAGELLASTNSTGARTVARTLEVALSRWERMPEDRRRGPAESDAPPAAAYPDGGLVLAVTVRDLPRGRDWNRDHAWFREEEARSLVPDPPAPGSTREVPAALVRRLARLHLLDAIHGQTVPYSEADIEVARLTARVTGVEGGRVRLSLWGRTRAVARGRWRTEGFRSKVRAQERGFDARLLGRAVFDRAAGRFTSFELVAAGTRWGATQYNGRADDPGPAGMGVLLELAGDSPADRVPPAFLDHYGW